MKEFLNTLKLTEKVTRENFYMVLGNCIIATVCGAIIALNILLQWGARNHMGSQLILIFMAITLVFIGFGLFPRDFQQALAMGKTRKYLFAGNYLLWFKNTLIVLLFAIGVCAVEELVYTRLVPESVCLLDMRPFLGNPLIFITILLCAPALIMFLGGMILRFGVNVFWGAVGACFLFWGFIKIKNNYPDCAVMRWLGIGGEPNVVGICTLCLVCGSVLLGIAWLSLRKQRVVI